MHRRGDRNRRKFEIEEARNNDGTYQAIKLFAKNTKIYVISAYNAFRDGYFLVEYERDGQPSVLGNKMIEFYAINFDLRDRIYFIRAEMMRKKARRYFRSNDIHIDGTVKYIKFPLSEMIRYA